MRRSSKTTRCVYTTGVIRRRHIAFLILLIRSRDTYEEKNGSRRPPRQSLGFRPFYGAALLKGKWRLKQTRFNWVGTITNKVRFADSFYQFPVRTIFTHGRFRRNRTQTTRSNPEPHLTEWRRKQFPRGGEWLGV